MTDNEDLEKVTSEFYKYKRLEQTNNEQLKHVGKDIERLTREVESLKESFIKVKELLDVRIEKLTNLTRIDNEISTKVKEYKVKLEQLDNKRLTLIEETKHVSRASLIKTLDKHLVEMNWPFARVKNAIKKLNLGTTRISHYEGLELLAEKKKIHINELIRINGHNYIYNNSFTY